MSASPMKDGLGVSIRSPRRSEGRSPAPATATATAPAFQSAPPAEARGDRPKIEMKDGKFVVSIRSPRRSEGRFAHGIP